MSADFSKLTTKGRTLVPKRVREHPGLRSGDLVRFRITDTGV